MKTFGHIINPVRVSPSSDLHRAQPVTFRSILEAKNHSAYKDHIKLYAICYEEDHEVCPQEFVRLPNLKRSVLDVRTFQKKRKLPLLADILAPFKIMNDVDYLVYSNVDIALMPYFYDYAIRKIELGADSLVVNRRVIEPANEYDFMIAEVGKPHPGFDCFVFRRELIERFDLGEGCVGANWIGRILLANLIYYSDKTQIIRDAHLTFHLGDDGTWTSGQYADYDNYNKAAAYRVIRGFLKHATDHEKFTRLKRLLYVMDNWEKYKRWEKFKRMRSATKRIVQRLVKVFF